MRARDVPPPPARVPVPLVHEWPEGAPIVRAHHSQFGATEFNPGAGRGRFHPIRTRAAAIPTMYGADVLEGALSETVFHNVPASGPGKQVSRHVLMPMLFSTIAARRPLKLIQLFGHGCRRIGIARRELIESEADEYQLTAGWAEVLHEAGAHDGLIWVSRQYDTSKAILLFGDRVARDELEVVKPPMSMHDGPGFDLVQASAEAAGIMIVAGERR